MKREEMIQEVEKKQDSWDVLIIGGGATGLGIAVDSASRGYKTLLLEQSDFAKATSSRSTKLIHGGLRYLQQGHLPLVMHALKERGLLLKNAPHLIHHLPFLIPNYQFWQGPFYTAGLKIYDLLAGSLRIEKSKHLNLQKTLEAVPNLTTKNLKGGVVYYDGQFDDARLAICLAKTAAAQGATLINYMQVVDLIKRNNKCIGIRAIDQESKKEYEIQARVIINATGVFVDQLIQCDEGVKEPIIAASQGVHLVLPRSFLPGHTAVLIPHTSDNRVLFLVPWREKVLLGTTDTAILKTSLEPQARQEEIEFLLNHAAKYLTKAPKREDVVSLFAGLRPLVQQHKTKKTAALSRDHTILISSSELITIAGGKWTTYRKMAEDAIDHAILVGKLKHHPCPTKTLQLHGWDPTLDPLDSLSTYGTDKTALQRLMKETPLNQQPIHPEFSYTQAEVRWAARFEMARSVEDVLARRSRALFLNAKKSIEAASLVAELLSQELGRDDNWQKSQIDQYTALAHHYF